MTIIIENIIVIITIFLKITITDHRKLQVKKILDVNRNKIMNINIKVIT